MVNIVRIIEGASYEVPFHWGGKSLDLYQYVVALPNRNLLKELRLSKELHEDVTLRIGQGWKMFLGELIHKVAITSKREVEVYQFEVDRRFNLGLITKNK